MVTKPICSNEGKVTKMVGGGSQAASLGCGAAAERGFLPVNDL